MEEIPNNHLGGIKPCKLWDKLSTSTGARRISEPSTVSFRQNDNFTSEMKNGSGKKMVPPRKRLDLPCLFKKWSQIVWSNGELSPLSPEWRNQTLKGICSNAWVFLGLKIWKEPLEKMVDFSRISGRNLRNFIDFSRIPGYPVMKNGNSWFWDTLMTWIARISTCKCCQHKRSKGSRGLSI